MADHTSEALNRRRVLVTGATSQIGVFAIPRLLNAGFHVVAVSRQPRPHYLPQSQRLEWLGFDQAMQAQGVPDQAEADHATQDQAEADHATQGQARQGDDSQDRALKEQALKEQALKDQATPALTTKISTSYPCNYLLSAGPMSLAVQVLASSKHFKQAVIFSSSSVIIKRESPDLAEKALIANMHVQEAELTTIANQQNLKMVIFRPTLIYGCGLDQNISKLATLIRRYGVMPVNGKGNGLRQPVHADDLAQVAVQALGFKQAMPANLLLTGGSTLSYANMVEAIFDALDQPVRILHLPQWLLIPAIRILKQLGLAKGISVAMVKRQLLDQAFDNLPAQQLLDYHPRPFAPTKKDFELPENRQHSSA